MPCMCCFQLSNGKNTTKNIDFVLGGDDCKKKRTAFHILRLGSL